MSHLHFSKQRYAFPAYYERQLFIPIIVIVEGIRAAQESPGGSREPREELERDASSVSSHAMVYVAREAQQSIDTRTCTRIRTYARAYVRHASEWERIARGSDAGAGVALCQ